MFKNYLTKKASGQIVVDETKINAALADPKAKFSIDVARYDQLTGEMSYMKHFITLAEIQRQRTELQLKLDGINAFIQNMENYNK